LTDSTLLFVHQRHGHPKVVQERLGHSQISVTLDTDSHVVPSLQEAAAAELNALLQPTSADGYRCASRATLRWGAVRATHRLFKRKNGADDPTRTDDLLITR
jgi:hypothetical protein